MKKAVHAITGLLLATMAGDALSGGYVGVGYGQLTYEESGISDEADLSAIFVRGGYRFNDYLAVEARVGKGAGDDTVRELGIAVDVELDYFYGAYLKAGVPLGKVVYPYVVVGATKGELKASAMGYDFSDDATDTSYGAGVDFRFNERVSLGLEYMNYIDKDGGELGGFSLGLDIQF